MSFKYREKFNAQKNFLRKEKETKFDKERDQC